jgi:transcriptional regulator with XRE-family HTH domain
MSVEVDANMDINQLLAQKNMTRYRLAKQSGIPQTTMTDICSGKAKLENCSGETLYRISKTLGVSMESLVSDAMEYRPGFETYKSNVCHRVKDMGDLEFLIITLESGEIRELYDKRWYAECLYLLAMVDYLSRENGFALCADYNDLRGAKLSKTIFPAGILGVCAAFDSDKPKEDSLREAIPEFLRHNIVESEVRNLV